MKAIDADALLQRWNNLLPRMARDKDGAVPIDFCLAIHEVSAAPTLTLDDLRPKGRWVNVRMLTTGDGRVRMGFCSCCGSAEKLKKYCPHCGADMRRGGEDG